MHRMNVRNRRRLRGDTTLTIAAWAKDGSKIDWFQALSRRDWAASRSQSALSRPRCPYSSSLECNKVARAKAANIREGCIFSRSEGSKRVRRKCCSLMNDSQ